MAGHAAFAAGFTRFFAGPLVGRALLVRSLAALARNLALFGAVHRGESAILFSHTSLPESLACPPHSARGEPVFAARRAPRTAAAHVRRSRTGQVATDVPRLRSSPSGRGSGDLVWSATRREEGEKGVQTRERFLATEERHHLEKPRTGCASGQRDPYRMDECAGLDAPVRCRSTHRGFHMWLILASQAG